MVSPHSSSLCARWALAFVCAASSACFATAGVATSPASREVAPAAAVAPAPPLPAAVRELTLRWANGDRSDVPALHRELDNEAAARQLSDWTREPAVYRAIGEGLRRSGLRDAALERVVNRLATGHPQALTWINAGYYSALRR